MSYCLKGLIRDFKFVYSEEIVIFYKISCETLDKLMIVLEKLLDAKSFRYY